MAAFEHDQPILGDPAARDPHVFAALTRRRARALRLAGFCVAMLSLAWIAALAFALLGAGAFPGALSAAKARPAPRPTVPHAPEKAHARSALGAAQLRAPDASGREVAPNTVAAARAAGSSHASATVAAPRAPAPRAPAPPAAPPPPPAAPRRGWAKRGWTAPPGRVKADQAPPRGAGGGGVADDPSVTAPGQSGSHAHNG